MPVGVILEEAGTYVNASFYIPCEKLALLRLSLGLPLACSHILLDACNLQTFESSVECKIRQWGSRILESSTLTLIFPLPLAEQLANLEDAKTLDQLLYIDQCSSNVSLVLLVPVVDSVEYWFKLWRLRKRYRLILDLSFPISKHLLPRYKCLSYDAVVINSNTITQGLNLISKRSLPQILLYQSEIEQRLNSTLPRIPQPKLKAHSDELIDPLQPLTKNLDLDVYETFELDQTKYSQYDGAIEMAIQDLHQKRSNLKILVVGPGRGPLLQMVMRYTKNDDAIIAVEKNDKCIDTLKEKIRNTPRVTLVHGDIRNLTNETYDLVVSELLGSFGCNEACPEILQHLHSTIMIPEMYRSYLQAAYCDIVDNFECKRPYIAHFNSLFVVGDPVPTFEFSHPNENQLEQKISLQILLSCLNPTNVLMGYFEAHLYRPFRIGITPDLYKHEYCSSWYPMVFPVGLVQASTNVLFSRKSTRNAVWYEWSVDGESYNRDGKEYVISL